MKALLSGTGLQYQIKGKTIVITAIPQKSVSKTLLNGHVTDSEGTSIPGVTIFTQDKSQGAVTDIDGRFSFLKPLEYGTVLTFSSIGMKSTNVVYSGEKDTAGCHGRRRATAGCSHRHRFPDNLA